MQEAEIGIMGVNMEGIVSYTITFALGFATCWLLFPALHPQAKQKEQRKMVDTAAATRVQVQAQQQPQQPQQPQHAEAVEGEFEEDEASSDGEGEGTVRDNYGGPFAGQYKMVLCVNMGLKMGKGKIAAQCSHATLGAYKRALRYCPEALKWWERIGQAKIAVKVDDTEEMLQIEEAARAVGLNTYVVVRELLFSLLYLARL
jgi:peptidyl-tRNA hydrolase